MTRPERVRIVEVGPRDGLQNEKGIVSTDVKVELINRLARAGVDYVEATSFVSPKWVPQMADNAEVMSRLGRPSGVRYAALVPNLKGFEAALASGLEEVAVFAAASESFSRKNINCSIDESVTRFEPIMKAAADAGVRVRGYVSCVVACPYEGDVAPDVVASVSARLFAMGCHEISLGDTIGVGAPDDVRRMIDAVARVVPVERLAGHFHDTYGMAVANVVAALEAGVTVFDASVAGLGGCPYAPGASGNVATEDVVYLLRRMGVETGIDLPALVDTAHWISGELGRRCASRVGAAMAHHDADRSC